MARTQEDAETEEALWQIAHEEAEDRSPAEWWDDELTFREGADAAELRAVLGDLVRRGCSRVELLQLLRGISGIANLGQLPRRDVESHLKKVEELTERLVVLPMSQLGPGLRGTDELLRGLMDHARQIREFLSKSARVPDVYLHEAEEQFVRYVHRHARGRHAEVAVLLRFATLRKKTEGAQRMATSRLKLPKKVKVKRVDPKITKAERGWLRTRRAKKSLTTHRDAVPVDIGRDPGQE